MHGANITQLVVHLPNSGWLPWMPRWCPLLWFVDAAEGRYSNDTSDPPDIVLDITQLLCITTKEPFI
jgi:hypothetical protein